MAAGRLKHLFGAAAISGVVIAGLLLAADRLLPPDMSRYEQSGRLVTDRNGEPLRFLPTRDGVWRLAIMPEAVDPQYLALLLAYEDQRFFHHPGIDPLAIARAAFSNLDAGRIVSGASTLTMQVARLLHGQAPSWGGKLAQALRALQLEWRYSKQDILAMYLTLAPFGGNIEGVHMASRLYFGKPPASLTLAESALLIALPQSPTRRRPLLHAGAALAGRAEVLRRLAEAGEIAASAAQTANAEALPGRRHELPLLAPHLAARAARQVDLAGVATIRTTLDAGLQQRLEHLVRQEAAWFPDPATLAILVAEIPGRRILASVGGHDYAGNQGQIDMTRAIRSPGSTLKPFIYGLALDRGDIHPDTVIDDRPTRFGSYLPRNFDRQYQGRVTIRAALQQSLNVPAVAVLERLGAGRFAADLDTLGIRLHLPAPREAPGLALALGGGGLSLRDLTALYALLADGGRYQPLTMTETGAAARPQPFIGPAAAQQIGEILTGAARPSGIQGAANASSDRIAYKTGTSYGFRDAWALGYTGSHVVGVWVGRPDGTPRPGAYGRNTAAPVLFRVFDLLGGRGGDLAPPQSLETIAHSAPLGLSQFRRQNGSPMHEGPRILFPPPQVELALPASADKPVVLEARGAAPLRWYVDGMPLASRDAGRHAEWAPPGPGFFRISVTDAEGRSSAVRTRLVSGD